MEIPSKREISDLDIWIEQLKFCQPLEEIQVKNLCDKVIKNNYFILFINRQKKYYLKNQMFN